MQSVQLLKLEVSVIVAALVTWADVQELRATQEVTHGPCAVSGVISGCSQALGTICCQWWSPAEAVLSLAPKLCPTQGTTIQARTVLILSDTGY